MTDEQSYKNKNIKKYMKINYIYQNMIYLGSNIYLNTSGMDIGQYLSDTNIEMFINATLFVLTDDFSEFMSDRCQISHESSTCYIYPTAGWQAKDYRKIYLMYQYTKK